MKGFIKSAENLARRRYAVQQAKRRPDRGWYEAEKLMRLIDAHRPTGAKGRRLTADEISTMAEQIAAVTVHSDREGLLGTLVACISADDHQRFVAT